MLMFGGDFGSRKHDRAEGEGLGFGAWSFLLGREKGILDPMREYDELLTLGGLCWASTTQNNTMFSICKPSN